VDGGHRTRGRWQRLRAKLGLCHSPFPLTRLRHGLEFPHAMALLGRDTSVTGPFPKGVLPLEALNGHEALGRTYRLSLSQGRTSSTC